MNNNQLNYDTFANELLTEVPEFRDTYDEHIADYDELLLHMLMGDFVRFLYQKYYEYAHDPNEKSNWEGIIQKSLKLMEDALMSEDPMLSNLVSVSFVENLEPEGTKEAEAYEYIKSLLGPNLQHELEYYYPE